MSECRTTAVSQDYASDNDNDMDNDEDENADSEAMTCNALCSLGSSDPTASQSQQHWDESGCFGDKLSGSYKCCPKQLQLPMFLSSK
jgi:hypothetical protein